MLTEISQIQKNKYYSILLLPGTYLYQETKIIKLIEGKCTRGWGRGNQGDVGERVNSQS